jgi:hypothetical protein
MIERWTNGPEGFVPKANHQLGQIENGLKLTGDSFINVRTTPAGKSVALNLPAVLRCVRQPSKTVEQALENFLMIGTVARDGGSEDNQSNEIKVHMPEGIRMADDWQPDRIYAPGITAYYAPIDEGFNWTASDNYVYEPLSFNDWDAEKSDYAAGDTVKYGAVPTGYEAKSGYTYPVNPYEPGTPEHEAWQVPAPPDDGANWKVYQGHYPRENSPNWQRHELGVKCIISGDSLEYPTGKLKNCMPFLMQDDAVMFVKIGEDYYCVWIFIEFIDHEQAIW